MSYFRSWMDNLKNDPTTNLLNEEYARGIDEFMNLACRQIEPQQTGKLKCPCSICRNTRKVKIDAVWTHLYRNGFLASYKIWFLHGERQEIGSTSEPYPANRVEECRTGINFGEGVVQMVNDRFREYVVGSDQHEEVNEEPNLAAKQFFDMLNASKKSLYKGCRDGHSPMTSETRLMSIQSEWNLPEECMDAINDYVRDLLPEDNIQPISYYEIQKLVMGLGLPFQVIDVCINNCMLYWRSDESRLTCRHCQEPRYKDTDGRVSVPHKWMWYLPITERLKRLYQSDRTAEAMRWHAEHRFDGEITQRMALVNQS